MKYLTPIKYKDLKEKCGEPGDTKDMVRAPFPFPLYLGGDKSLICRNFYGNKKIVGPLMEALQEIKDIYGMRFIQENNLDWYGGCFENRATRGGVRKSVHSWGMAVDYLPQLGALGEPSLVPYHVVMAFKKRGFLWGGDWNRPDGMHFSAVEE